MSVRKRILLIPHCSFRNYLRIREFELARVLSTKYQVYYLTWFLHQSNFFSKAMTQIKNLFPNIYITVVDGVNILHAPKAQIKTKLSLLLNEWVLNRIIKQFNINIIINASQFYCPVNNKKLKVGYLYDLVDDHFMGLHTEAEYVKREIQKADKITTITKELQSKIAHICSRHSIVIPNGVWLEEIRTTDPYMLNELKQRYNITNEFIITYIGNHQSSWSNLSFIIRSFSIFKKENQNSKLFIVGPGEEIPKLKKENRDKDIIFTGPIEASEIKYFFQLSDIGVIPFKLFSYTHNALPIKVIEYSAARKIIVASKLRSVQNLKFPNIVFSELDEAIWARKMNEAKQLLWNNDWDQHIMEYDWQRLGERLISEIETLF